MFAFWEKTDQGGKVLVCTGPNNTPFTRVGGTQLGPFSHTAQNALVEAAFCKPKLCSGIQPQPHRAKEGLGCIWLRVPCCMAGGLHGLKLTPNVFSFREKADLAGKGLVFTGPCHPPFASYGGNQLGPISDTAKPRFGKLHTGT